MHGRNLVCVGQEEDVLSRHLHEHNEGAADDDGKPNDDKGGSPSFVIMAVCVSVRGMCARGGSRYG